MRSFSRENLLTRVFGCKNLQWRAFCRENLQPPVLCREKFANARSTKGFVGFFAVHKRLPTSATLGLRSLNYLCSTISDFWTFQLQFLHFCSKFLVISFHSKQIQSITKRFFSWKTDLFKNSDVISLWFDFKSSWPSSITFVSDPRKSINHLFTIKWEGEGSGLFRTFRDFWTGPTPCTRTNRPKIFFQFPIQESRRTRCKTEKNNESNTVPLWLITQFFLCFLTWKLWFFACVWLSWINGSTGDTISPWVQSRIQIYSNSQVRWEPCLLEFCTVVCCLVMDDDEIEFDRYSLQGKRLVCPLKMCNLVLQLPAFSYGVLKGTRTLS